MRNMDAIGYVSAVATPEILEAKVDTTLENFSDLSYFFGPEADSVQVDPVQYPDKNVIERCAVIRDFSKKEDLEKLFSSFKRLELDKNRNIEGTGLGLNIAKQLAKLMQGDINVESEYGKGSTFTVYIPQKVMDKQPVGDFEKALQESRKENDLSENFFTAPDASVLIVDDNAVNRSVMKSLLKRTKINVDLAAGGKECLELTKQKKYDVILMDHMMPELDGVETLHMLRTDNSNSNCDTVVIALTANAIAGCREMYLEYGFDDYFSKPIQADKLEMLIFHYLPETLVHMNE